GRRRIQRLRQPKMLAVERLRVAAEHVMRDLESLFQQFEALPERREGYGEPPPLAYVPARADAEPGAALREQVQRCDLLDEHTRMAEMDSAHQRAEPCPPGMRRQKTERGVRLEHGLLGLADRADLEQMVHQPDGSEAGVIGRASHRSQRLGCLERAAGPAESRELQAQLHRITPDAEQAARSQRPTL